MATVNEILVAAYGRSVRFNNQQLATQSSELLQAVTRTVRGVFALTARISPTYYGESAAASYSGGRWAWPAGAELMFYLEHGGEEVVVVPFDQRDAEPTKKAVYAMGKYFYSAGNTGDPTSGNLTVYFSRRPVDPADVTDPIDPDFPESHLDLIISEIAYYLAIKDGRGDEAGFIESRDRALALYAAHVEHVFSSMERRKYGHVRRFNLQALVPNGALLGGGVAG
jgi:hypothetical protein